MCTNHDEVNKSEVDSHPWNRLLNSPFYTGFILINSDKVYTISFKSGQDPITPKQMCKTEFLVQHQIWGCEYM